MCVCVSLLEQLDVAHDELLPVDEDHGHLLLRQQLAVQQRFVEDLNTRREKAPQVPPIINTNILLDFYEYVSIDL